MARSAFLAVLLAGALAAPPAFAQFGSIFGGDGPPRPPANVPERPSAPVPSQPQYIPPPGGLLPAGPPPGPRIRSEPLPPPPGAMSAPPRAGNPPPEGQPATAAQPPSGQQRPVRSANAPASTVPQPDNETVVEPPPHRIANPTAVFSGLDKITGRIISFDVAINETVRFGALEVTPRACYSRPPTEAPLTDGFVEVDELTLQGELKRIFNGWMFAASPGLNAVEHPIYDVWLTECKGGKEPTLAEGPPPAPAAPPAHVPPRSQPQRRATQQLPPPPPPPAR